MPALHSRSPKAIGFWYEAAFLWNGSSRLKLGHRRRVELPIIRGDSRDSRASVFHGRDDHAPLHFTQRLGVSAGGFWEKGTVLLKLGLTRSGCFMDFDFGIFRGAYVGQGVPPDIEWIPSQAGRPRYIPDRYWRLVGKK